MKKKKRKKNAKKKGWEGWNEAHVGAKACALRSPRGNAIAGAEKAG